MTTHKEALTLALEVLVWVDIYAEPHRNTHKAITAIKETLAQQSNEQVEPVAYGMWDSMIGCGGRMMCVRLDKGQDGCTVPLYTTPQQIKLLTDDEIWKFWWSRPEVPDGEDDSMEAEFVATVRRVLAAHGIKGEA